MQMKEINAVLFDLDGTMVDSNQLLIDTFKDTFDQYFPDIYFNHQDYIDMIGPSLAETFSIYQKDMDIVNQMIEHFINFYKIKEIESIHLYPNLIETLKQLKKLNIQTGIVTTKRKKSALPSIKHFQLDQLIDIYVYLDDVKYPKPHAEPILYAKSMLKKPKEIIFIGDNPSDILSGKNAGILTCGVEWSYKKDALKDSYPDFWIKDYQELLSIIHQYNKEV